MARGPASSTPRQAEDGFAVELKAVSSHRSPKSRVTARFLREALWSAAINRRFGLRSGALRSSVFAYAPRQVRGLELGISGMGQGSYREAPSRSPSSWGDGFELIAKFISRSHKCNPPCRFSKKIGIKMEGRTVLSVVLKSA